MASFAATRAAPLSVDDRVRAVVRALLSTYDMTRKELAVAVGMTENQLGDRMRGSPFRVGELVAIAEYFDLPLSSFVAGPLALLGSAAQGSVTHKKHTQLGDVRADRPAPTRPRALSLVAA